MAARAEPATSAPTPAAEPAKAPEEERLSNTTATLPIVYGSVAFYLGKNADEFQTHEWTLFVRGPNQEDLSPVISKVVFQLHASFAQPVREYTQPPFEVTERGWGEFEAQIRIHWKDPTEKMTIINHLIRLYPPGAAPTASLLAEDAPPVVAESYDEIVFTNPHESFYSNLVRIASMPKVESSQQEHLQKVFNDNDDFLALIEAQKFLQEELSKAKQKFKVVTDELTSVDQSLASAQQQQQQREAASKKAKAAAAQRKSKPSSQASKKAKTS
eukprot:CAMPEP_0176094962 /NCGR_PEP_ID=MMETSP0120_2-20121206/47592_1 /TAXON_ID=160619 /ORGANISM="Kryptoperidinium foliaceum, Strain CCMP 1326" /LENGTH=271 /DNA_ID=CAMNT_0017428917 /DNA_START=131 /DNA_END=946 /DNA_ORIENTATION=+